MPVHWVRSLQINDVPLHSVISFSDFLFAHSVQLRIYILQSLGADNLVEILDP